MAGNIPRSNWTSAYDSQAQDGGLVLFRLYAPTEAFFDRTWAFPDFEVVTP